MIKEWLEGYHPQNKMEASHALREIMQEVALAGLYRAGFFEKAAFYGGTALRIFYDLDRFSEDLDFSLLESDPGFSLVPYLSAVQQEFAAMGMEVSVREKIKSQQTAIESAFLKSETIWRELILERVMPQAGLNERINIKIKLEVDTKPPLGFRTEEKLSLRPFSFYVKCFSLPDLFAGKMHALLFRKWKNNVKGRDWYDMEWYIKRGTPLHLNHFLQRAKDSGDYQNDSITELQLRDLLGARIETVNLNRIKEDVSRFINNPQSLDIWSPDYFQDLILQLKVVD